MKKTNENNGWLVVVHGNVDAGQGVYMYGPFNSYNDADEWRCANENAFSGRAAVCVRHEIINPAINE